VPPGVEEFPMDEQYFLDHYLTPSESHLDDRFRQPLPDIPGLVRQNEYIIQCQTGDTCSTNIIGVYQDDDRGLKLQEVYKNTQNRVSGNFVRLIGSMSLLAPGYPRTALDAAVINVNPVTGVSEGLTTRVMVHLPQATTAQHELFYRRLEQGAAAANLPYVARSVDHLPDFWGGFGYSESVGINLAAIRQLRNATWDAYRVILEETEARIPFDYQPFIEHMVFATAEREHELFARMGLAVPKEAQSAFFSVQV
jgi:hypothetical protein